MPDSITQNIQEMDTGRTIELWKFDLLSAGIPVADNFFTPSYDKDNSSTGYVKYDSQDYYPMQMTSSGFSWDGAGKLPTPSVTFSNVFEIFTLYNNAYDDMSGVEVTRMVTFEIFLDELRDGTANPDADPDAHLPIEVYRINRKTNENEMEVTYELNASIDQEGQKIPRRQFIRNYCPLVYRVYDPNADPSSPFNYKNVTCPYSGSEYFKEDGQSTDSASEDICSHQIESGCKKRFIGSRSYYSQDPIPFGGFPGLANLPT